jgi:ABC-type transport system involved in multi-copper enzyme maturation permease subunit
MSPAAEILLVAQRELRTNLRSAKGVALLVLSLLGGGLTALLFAHKAGEPQALGLSGTSVSDAAPALLAIFGLKTILVTTIWLTPMLVSLLGFDAISGELQHRSVRYWTVRTRRASFYIGKVLGLWAVVSAVTLFMDALVWLVFLTMVKDAGDVLKVGPLLWLVSLPISLAWASIASLVGSQFRAPMLALMMIWATFFALFIVSVIGAAKKIDALGFVYPNFYEDWMLGDDAKKAALGAIMCVGLGAIVTTAGALGFARRDV